jgi:hypothetical protein
MDNILPCLKDIEAMSSVFAQSAQVVYDNWQQDGDGFDEELGAGGICHLIADAMATDIFNTFPNARACTRCLSDEQHVNVLISVREGVYELDIPYRIYETGGGFTWTKREGIIFDAQHISLDALSNDPSEMWKFVEYGELDEELAFATLKLFDDPQITITKAVEIVTHRYGSEHNRSEMKGQCVSISNEVAEILTSCNLECHIVHGILNENTPHTWVECEDFILDPTRNQFSQSSSDEGVVDIDSKEADTYKARERIHYIAPSGLSL